MAGQITIPADQIVGSASVNGAFIGVASAVSPGTLLHQGAETGWVWERVTILACNTDSVPRSLTIVWGTNAPGASDIVMKSMLAQDGFKLIIDRFPQRRGRPVYAYASVANVINCFVEIAQL